MLQSWLDPGALPVALFPSLSRRDSKGTASNWKQSSSLFPLIPKKRNLLSTKSTDQRPRAATHLPGLGHTPGGGGDRGVVVTGQSDKPISGGI